MHALAEGDTEHTYYTVVPYENQVALLQHLVEYLYTINKQGPICVCVCV